MKKIKERLQNPDKRFYILNALTWLVLFCISIEPISEIVTKPWQLWMTLSIAILVLYLIAESIVIFKGGEE